MFWVCVLMIADIFLGRLFVFWFCVLIIVDSRGEGLTSNIQPINHFKLPQMLTHVSSSFYYKMHVNVDTTVYDLILTRIKQKHFFSLLSDLIHISCYITNVLNK